MQQENTKCRCLIVEDNALAAELMVRFLRRNDIAADTAENGQTGLQMYLEAPSRYDVIFLDIQMPVMDGYEMARKIRTSATANAAAIPIVAMSGNNMSDENGRAYMTRFLKKPFDFSALLVVLSEVLNL